LFGITEQANPERHQEFRERNKHHAKLFRVPSILGGVWSVPPEFSPADDHVAARRSRQSPSGPHSDHEDDNIYGDADSGRNHRRFPFIVHFFGSACHAR
jgi:hypothetical protein